MFPDYLEFYASFWYLDILNMNKGIIVNMMKCLKINQSNLDVDWNFMLKEGVIH